MAWEKVKLGDVSTCIQPGPFGSQLHNSDYSESGTPIIMPKDMIDGKISHSNLVFVGEEHTKRLCRHQVHSGNLMVARKGDVRKCVFITENEEGWMTGSDCLKVALKEDVCHPKFIYYQLRSPFIGRWLEKISIGATMPSINTGLLSGIELMLPPLKTQKRIADILSAYDDLIENNQKQIKLLEESAQRLYKQWFIDLKFLGHETTKIVDGLPEGWKKERADLFFNITIGKTPPRAEKQWFVEGGCGVPWISISDMGTDSAFIFETTEDLTSEAIKRHNVKVVPPNTVLLSFKLTVGRVSITTNDMCTNEAIAHFVSEDDLLREYTYCYLKNFHYDELGSTSSISKAINSKIVKAMPFVMPSDDALKAFHEVMKPIFDEIFTKQKQIKNLSQSRDRLLPKLMNGEII
jgi:type I restriction enzyme S subunit